MSKESEHAIVVCVSGVLGGCTTKKYSSINRTGISTAIIIS